jgi:hypothetical protein
MKYICTDNTISFTLENKTYTFNKSTKEYDLVKEGITENRPEQYFKFLVKKKEISVIKERLLNNNFD